jgi:hypothetical protein
MTGSHKSLSVTLGSSFPFRFLLHVQLCSDSQVGALSSVNKQQMLSDVKLADFEKPENMIYLFVLAY